MGTKVSAWVYVVLRCISNELWIGNDYCVNLVHTNYTFQRISGPDGGLVRAIMICIDMYWILIVYTLKDGFIFLMSAHSHCKPLSFFRLCPIVRSVICFICSVSLHLLLLYNTLSTLSILSRIHYLLCSYGPPQPVKNITGLSYDSAHQTMWISSSKGAARYSYKVITMLLSFCCDCVRIAVDQFLSLFMSLSPLQTQEWNYYFGPRWLPARGFESGNVVSRYMYVFVCVRACYEQVYISTLNLFICECWYW